MTAAQPMSRQARESRAVSVKFETPVPGIRELGSMPLSISPWIASMRSAMPTDNASPVVPKGTSPAQPSASRRCARST